MKFEDMMTFWKMKSMIHQESCLTRDKMYDSNDQHVTFLLELRDRQNRGFHHANIIYRAVVKNGVKTKFALINADILNTGWSGSPSEIFIKNAKVSDLRDKFVNEL